MKAMHSTVAKFFRAIRRQRPVLPMTGLLAALAWGGVAAQEPVPNRLAQEPVPNRLTPEEETEGWRLLFDGTSLAGWRGYRQEGVPAGWSADEGVLTFAPGASGDGGQDLITIEQFADFELSLEWKIGPGGNSGVFYRATEEERAPYWTGPEMQILDDDAHADGGNPKTSAGSNYALHGPSSKATRPVGEWNHARIVVNGGRVEHWLNGTRVVAYELWTQEWEAAVAETKFADWPRYGRARQGHVGLQDHGDPVWFRNIKVRTR